MGACTKLCGVLFISSRFTDGVSNFLQCCCSVCVPVCVLIVLILMATVNQPVCFASQIITCALCLFSCYYKSLLSLLFTSSLSEFVTADVYEKLLLPICSVTHKVFVYLVRFFQNYSRSG